MTPCVLSLGAKKPVSAIGCALRTERLLAAAYIRRARRDGAAALAIPSKGGA